MKIINAASKVVLDSTPATAESNGTITAQSPVHYVAPPPPGQLSLSPTGWVVDHPLPTCGVTLQATLTDVTTGSSEAGRRGGLPAAPAAPK